MFWYGRQRRGVGVGLVASFEYVRVFLGYRSTLTICTDKLRPVGSDY